MALIEKTPRTCTPIQSWSKEYLRSSVDKMDIGMIISLCLDKRPLAGIFELAVAYGSRTGRNEPAKCVQNQRSAYETGKGP